MARSSEITNLHYGDVIGKNYTLTVVVTNDGAAAVTVTASCPGSTVQPTGGYTVAANTPATEREFTLTHTGTSTDETVSVEMKENGMVVAAGGDAVEEVDIENDVRRIGIDDEVIIEENGEFKIERLGRLAAVQAGFYGGKYNPGNLNNVSVLVLVQRVRKVNNHKRYKTRVAKVAQLYVTGGANPVRRWQAELPPVEQPNNGRLVIRVLLLHRNGKVVQTTGYPNP